MQFHEDDRAQRLIDLFPVQGGQINVSYVNSTDHIVAWHGHVVNFDYWICVKGSFKVGLAKFGPHGKHEVTWEYLSDKNPRVLKISPGTWHGYKALEPGSILLYYLSERYDPNDDMRKPVGEFNEIWDTPNK